MMSRNEARPKHDKARTLFQRQTENQSQKVKGAQNAQIQSHSIGSKSNESNQIWPKFSPNLAACLKQKLSISATRDCLSPTQKGKKGRLFA